MMSFLRRLLTPVALLALTALPGRAWAITESYCSFPSSLTTFTLNGNAFGAQQSVIRLTSNNALNEASSAFVTTPLNLTATTSLHAFFRFQIGPNATGGDGVAFVLQNSAAGAAALGANDGNLGFLGTGKIAPAVVVDFVTYANTGGLTNANRVGLLTVTNTTTTVVTLATPAFTMAGSSMVYAWVDYNGTSKQLSVYLNNAPTKPASALIANASVNLFTLIGATAYVGFSASTGKIAAETNQQDIVELELSTDGVPCSCEGDAACSGVPATPACGSAGLCAVCSATNHAACTGAKPVCNVPTATCVGCLSNADCGGVNRICDKITLTCRACSSNADCSGSTPICDTTAGSANLGLCVTCVTDTNCPPASPRCNPATNTCTQCLTGADCGGNTPVCKANKCSACAADADCSGATPACEVWGACGQCSATNASQCAGSTGVCDDPTGTCVGCEFNTDCAGSTPTCDTTTHTCRPCTGNPDCVGNPSGPACVTSGMKTGACVVCQVDGDCTSPAAPKCDTTANLCVTCLSSADCRGSTPVCKTASNLCVGCLSSADCSGATPVCDTTTSTCRPCANDYAATNPGPNPCPTAALPACQPTGSPLAGQCGVCSSLNNSVCATQAATPACSTEAATCGCNLDSDCKASDYCDTSSVASGVCTTGCRVLDGGVTNCASGMHCTQMNGSVGTCMSEPCNSNADCPASTPVCDTLGPPFSCVGCLNDSDCTKAGLGVCDGTSHTCVQCSPTDVKSCTGNTPLCLANGTCGCAMDGDCGGPNSGAVCDGTAHACVPGCRGSGGNGCGPGMTCSSSDTMVGTCQSSSSSSSSSSSGMGGTGAGDAGAGGAGGNDLAPAKGCGCVVAGEDGGGALLGLAALLAAFGLTAGRRSSRRKVA